MPAVLQGALDERPQPLAPADALRAARHLFGLEGEASPLPGEYDANFRLRTAGGDFVLKAMHPARERGFVDLQVAALRHLERRAPELRLPRVVLTRRGEPLEAFSAGGASRLFFALSFVPGTPLAEARPRTRDLHASLGRLLGRLDRGLADFEHAAATRDLKWDLAKAAWIREHLGHIQDPARRALVEDVLGRFEQRVVPALPRLRRGVIHGDANDWNALVDGPRATLPEVVSVIDFGDMHHGLVAAEVAIAAAYALLGQPDPLATAADVVAGYHGAFPLAEEEAELLFALITARLAVSVTNSALRKAQVPNDAYVTVSEAPAWEALERLARVPAPLATALFRSVCGRHPVAGGPRAVEWLHAHGRSAQGPASLLEADLRREQVVVFDLGVASLFLGADPAAAQTGPLSVAIDRALDEAGARIGIGRYDEARRLYVSPLFGGDGLDERRTVHLGIDVFVPAGETMHAPLDGVVHLFANNRAPQDYGPLIVLRHEPAEGMAFFTLYGHLSEDSLEGLAVGQRVSRGQPFARVGSPPSNGDWPPHVHFQLVLDLVGLGTDFPGVALASQRALWCALSPDPNLLLSIPQERFPVAGPSPEETLRVRKRLLGRNLSLSYRSPLKIVRGFRQHLFDETGRAYLDAYNNVPLVGHGHPRVVRAAQEQLALLNTNTRYLHDNAVRYAERLTALLPEPLRVCYFLNSGSEANELALRLARARTGRDDVIVLEHAYHGHTQGLIDVSPYKFDGPGGRGRKSFVHVAPLPDDYRGLYRRGDPEAGVRYASHVAAIVRALPGGAAFLAETLPSVGGQIVLPPGYLKEAYRHVRGRGGVCIADEVQVGFGRLGTHFWGFASQDVVPDVVVLGKPIGNGFPLAAVVTTPEIAGAFDNGMEFFSTFGGNPVACAAGLAVLDVLRDEGLQENARLVGSHLIEGLRGLMDRDPLVGDVRGSGLFLGVELVRDRTTLEPATEEAAYVVNRLRDHGILTGTDGPHDNVLKLRPPLVLEAGDADLLVATLGEVLSEDPIRAPRG